MLSIVVTAVITLTGSAQAGYFYPRPNVVFELPKNEPNLQDGFTKTRQENAAQQTHETVVSYSVPYEDIYYLHQNKIGHQTRPTLATSTRTIHTGGVPSVNVRTVQPLSTSASVEPKLTGNISLDILHTAVPAAIPSLSLPVSINPQSDLVLNSVQEYNSHAPSIANVNFSTLIKQQSNLPVNTVQHVIDIPSHQYNIPTAINQQNNLAINTFPNVNIPTDNKPTVNLPIKLNLQSSLELNPVHQINIPSVNVQSVNLPTIIDQESNLRLNTQQDITNHVVSNDLYGSIDAQNVVSPKITKDIYFHVPPPEFEEPAIHKVIPKKKIYKIIFIKAPTQETKNIAQIQRFANGIAPIEDKTIIYVLSKKPEHPQVFLPKPVPSEHEVLFVKYSGDPVGATTLGNENLEQLDSEVFVTSRLQPGVINGKREVSKS